MRLSFIKEMRSSIINEVRSFFINEMRTYIRSISPTNVCHHLKSVISILHVNNTSHSLVLSVVAISTFQLNVCLEWYMDGSFKNLLVPVWCPMRLPNIIDCVKYEYILSYLNRDFGVVTYWWSSYIYNPIWLP